MKGYAMHIHNLSNPPNQPTEETQSLRLISTQHIPGCIFTVSTVLNPSYDYEQIIRDDLDRIHLATADELFLLAHDEGDTDIKYHECVQVLKSMKKGFHSFSHHTLYEIHQNLKQKADLEKLKWMKHPEINGVLIKKENGKLYVHGFEKVAFYQIEKQDPRASKKRKHAFDRLRDLAFEHWHLLSNKIKLYELASLSEIR
jgi:hypothetical protein